MHVIAHAQTVDGHVLGPLLYGVAYVCHCLVGEACHIAFLDGVVVGACVERVHGVCDLRVANDDHLVEALLAVGQTLQAEVILLALSCYGQVEAGGVVGVGVDRHLAVVGHGVEHKLCVLVASEGVMSGRVGAHYPDAVAHHHAHGGAAVAEGQRAANRVGDVSERVESACLKPCPRLARDLSQHALHGCRVYGCLVSGLHSLVLRHGEHG